MLIGLLTAITGLIWALVALERAGKTLSFASPFTWYRSTEWRKQYGQKPLYSLREPVDVAGVLLLGMAKCEGEVSGRQKSELVAIFEREFHLNAKDAADLLVASAHLLRDEVYIFDSLPQILAPSAAAFTREHVSSLLELMHRIATLESPLKDEQTKLLAATEHYYRPKTARAGNW